ncbi:MAG: hypothetical protein COV67_01565 [Nitrospinae bacterium CG11_big_fil_rev_8_21_14_0_20_56_8]|nr:MAG: hypothetical protein COV67_01565 [Nitrospinae bacterium CG11_big_fil_rev_8_21_14_0_20_56_8]
MFFEVKVYDANGDLKKVISPKKLSNRFWKEDGKLPMLDGMVVEEENRGWSRREVQKLNVHTEESG